MTIPCLRTIPRVPKLGKKNHLKKVLNWAKKKGAKVSDELKKILPEKILAIELTKAVEKVKTVVHLDQMVPQEH